MMSKTKKTWLSPQFRAWITGLREARGLSQAALALEADVNQANVNKFEASKRDASDDMLMRLAGPLGVGVREILERAARDRLQQQGFDVEESAGAVAQEPPPQPYADERITGPNCRPFTARERQMVARLQALGALKDSPSMAPGAQIWRADEAQRPAALADLLDGLGEESGEMKASGRS